jgi:hypothetical protein
MKRGSRSKFEAGHADPTAREALENIERGQRREGHEQYHKSGRDGGSHRDSYEASRESSRHDQ